jgi:hypothetical protein
VLGAALVALAAAPRRAAAQYNGALVTMNGNCMLPWEGLSSAPKKVAVRVGSCTQSGARYYIANGVVRTSDGLCLDHGVSSAMTPTASNDGVVFVACHGGDSQVWYFVRNGLAQNRANPKVCLDIENGADAQGTRVIVWPCDYKSDAQNAYCFSGSTSNCPRPNQRVYVGMGGVSSTTLATSLPSTAITVLNNGGKLTFDTGMKIVAGGGGNVVAAGAGNVVAGGAGNLAYITAGLRSGVGIVATDGATLIGQDGTSIARVIAASGSFRAF